MLVPNLLPKVVPHGSRLLPGLIVRTRGRLVAGAPSLLRAQGKPGRPALLSDPEVITLAILAQWPRFRSERDFWRFASAHLRSYFPNLCTQSQFNRRVRALEPELRALQRAFAGEICRAFGRLPRLGHDPGAGHGPGEGFSQGAVLRAGDLREERLQDRVGLRVQGGAGGGSRGRGNRFRPRPRGLRRAPHRGGAHSRRPSRSLPGRQRASRGSSGRGTGWSATGLWWLPPRRTTPAGHGRRPIGDGPPASARSSRG